MFIIFFIIVCPCQITDISYSGIVCYPRNISPCINKYRNLHTAWQRNIVFGLDILLCDFVFDIVYFYKLTVISLVCARNLPGRLIAWKIDFDIIAVIYVVHSSRSKLFKIHCVSDWVINAVENISIVRLEIYYRILTSLGKLIDYKHILWIYYRYVTRLIVFNHNRINVKILAVDNGNRSVVKIEILIGICSEILSVVDKAEAFINLDILYLSVSFIWKCVVLEFFKIGCVYNGDFILARFLPAKKLIVLVLGLMNENSDFSADIISYSRLVIIKLKLKSV